mgnify:CR=1 FL=1
MHLSHSVSQYIKQLNWIVVVFTLLVFFGLIKLGLWQSERANEKEERLTKIERLKNQDSIPLENINELFQSGEDINDLPVRTRGIFDAHQFFLLDNQTNSGRLGYRVLQLVQSTHGLVLVNMGWVQGSVNRAELPDIASVSGEHEFKGNVRIVDKGITLMAEVYDEVSWPLRVQQIELDKISQLIGQKLLPFVIYLDKKESIGFEKNWQPIVMPPEKHRAYAFQWFGLATAWIVLMISASRWFANNPDKKIKTIRSD